MSKATQVSGFSTGQVLYVNGSVVGAKTLTATGIGAAAAGHTHKYAGASQRGRRGQQRGEAANRPGPDHREHQKDL